MKRPPAYAPKQIHRNRQVNLIQATFSRVAALYQGNQHAQALELCRSKLLKLAPGHVGGLLYAGVICYLRGDYPDAERYLKAAAAAGSPDAYTNLGLTLAALHRLPEAEDAYRCAVALNPQAAQAWNNLGNILKNSFTRERRLEALDCYRKAIAARPGYASAHDNLGHGLDTILRDRAGAEESFRAAIAHDAAYIPALLNLADILERTSRPQEALDCLRQALLLQPDDARILGRSIGLRRKLADWDETKGPAMADFVAALSSEHITDCEPLSLLAWPEIDALTQRRMAALFGRARWANALAAPPLVSPVATAHAGPLRVGYLSPDFRNHPVAHLITEVIAAHDRQSFQTFLYAYGPEVEDEERRRLIQAADHFTVVSQMDDQDVATRIRDDRIDILVDLAGYTTHTRPGICALRPAPVIASWLGYIGTLGEPRLADYLIGDAIATPPEHAAHFSETLALMPECFQPNCSLAPLAPAPTRTEEGLPQDAVVFCSFNQTFKLTPQLWNDWCAILRGTPGSVLWLAPGSSQIIRDNLLAEAAKHGIPAERIVFATHKPLAEHRARIALADIALDTYPYNSGATASDTLRAGVPLVTHMGETFVSRMAASLLHALDMPELCADSRTSYIALAIALANDDARRASLRQKLAERLPLSVLYQPGRFARQLEQLFQTMHAQALTGRREIIDLTGRTVFERAE